MDVLRAEPSEPGRLLNRIENFAPFHPQLADLLAGDLLVGAVSSLLGERAVLFKDKVNFKLPGGGGFEAHQDAQAGWNAYASRFITFALAVDRTTRENGCLELAHWKHRPELIGELWSPLSEENLADVQFVPYPMEPGDVAFFDAYLPHRSAPNATRERRRVLYVTYNRASEGDHRARYYADKHANYPPDCEREPGKQYAYRV
jgi:ectoine hydroxylase-related dioxygenase (phytanoyl-CoA dioxygenase family)